MSDNEFVLLANVAVSAATHYFYFFCSVAVGYKNEEAIEIAW